MEEREIDLTKRDLQKLCSIIEIYNGNDAPYVEHLKEELDRAIIVNSRDIPSDVVTMNSIVRTKDLDTGDEKTLILVFPGKQYATEKTVSILAPIGTALIGYR